MKENQYRTELRLLVTVFALATLLDIISTILCLELRVSHEGNPVVQAVLDRFGYGGFIVVKTVSIGLFYVLVSYARKSPVLVTAWLVTALILSVALYNFSLLFDLNRPSLI